MRAEALALALLPLLGACHGRPPELAELPSPLRLAAAQVRPIALYVRAQGLVLRRDGNLLIELSASAADSALLKPGMEALADDLQNGASWNCRVTEVLGNASLETGAGVAWLEPLSGTGQLKEGDFVSGRILARWMPRSLVVPSSAVLIHGGSTVVVLRRGEAMQVAAVRCGVDSGEFTQILSGLKEGDLVASEGATGYLAPEFKSHPND